MDSLKTNQQIKINTEEADKFCFKFVFPHCLSLLKHEPTLPTMQL